MKKVAFGLTIVASLLGGAIGCKDRSGSVSIVSSRLPVPHGQANSQQTVRAGNTHLEFVETLDKNPKNLVKAVSEGHQPWRLDPTFVAQCYVEFLPDNNSIPGKLGDDLRKLSGSDPVIDSKDALHRTAVWNVRDLYVSIFMVGVRGSNAEVVWQVQRCQIDVPEK